MSVYAEANLNQEVRVLTAPAVRTVAANAGLNWTLAHGVGLAVRGRYTRDTGTLFGELGFPLDPASITTLGSYLLNRSLNGHQLNVRIQKNISWGRRPLLGGPGGDITRATEFGNVAGLVFDDLDSDGRLGAGEAGVTNVAVKLNGNVVAWVDDGGRFSFRDVPVGQHTVELDLRSVPATYDVGPGWRIAVDVATRETTIRQFPLVQLGKISGRVVALKKTGVPADLRGPRPARNILVVLNGGLKTTVTDVDGEFEFTSLPAGSYQVRIGRSSLPQYWVVEREPARPVALEPGGRLAGLELRVVVTPRPTRLVTIDQPLPNREP